MSRMDSTTTHEIALIQYEYLMSSKRYDDARGLLKGMKAPKEQIAYVEKLQELEEDQWKIYKRGFLLVGIVLASIFAIFLSEGMVTAKSFLNPYFLIFAVGTLLNLLISRYSFIYSKVDKVNDALPQITILAFIFLFFYMISAK